MNSLKVKIQTLSPEHIDDLLKIAEELNLSNWSKEDYLSEISRDDSVAFIIEQKGRVIGFIISRLIISRLNYSNQQNISSKLALYKYREDEHIEHQEMVCEIFNIGIAKSFQKKGLGKMLLDLLIEQILAFKKATIWLEVRSSNRRAVKFYRDNLFEECYKRKNYYVVPTDDAIVMKREFIK